MPGDPVRDKFIETDEFLDSLKELKRTLARSEYRALISIVVRETIRLSDDPDRLPQLDPSYPDEPETRVHHLVPRFVLIYRVLPKTKDPGPRILLQSVQCVQEKK
jgi:hypothetical protein